MSDVFQMPIDFAPPTETLEALVHSTDCYHVVIGLDPIGAFHEVTGLSAENPVFSYAELGRNRSPVQLPWEGPRTGGEVTLAWGTILRARFWNWFSAQSPYMMERQPVFILHLSRRNLPLRVFVLWDAWPKSWSYSDLGNNEVTVEKVTLVYDRMFMLDTALLALIPELTGGVTAAPDLEDPPVIVQGQWTDTDAEKQPAVELVPQAKFAWNEPTTAPLFTSKEREKGKFEDKDGPPPEDEEREEEEYEGRVGTFDTEALPEEYVALLGLWHGVDGKKVYGKAAAAAAASGGDDDGGGGDDGGSAGDDGGGGADGDGGDGKAVEEDED